MDVKVSVLVPVYRTKEEYLRAAIESILNQTFRDFELIMLDDCPEDSREALIMSYGDSRIVYARNELNLGITPSRNKLLGMARGEYVAIFDHDDISRPMRLEKEVAYLDAHPECGLVSSWVGEVDDPSNVTKQPVDDDDIRIMLMWDCPITHSAALIRKSVLTENRIRYEEYFSPAEDYGLFSRLIGVTKFHNLPEVLFDYRSHAGNTSKTQKDRMLRGGYRVRAMNKALYPALWNEYEMRAVRTWRIRLFGIIPFLNIRQENRKTQIRLFGIPVLKVRSWCRMWR